MQTTYFHHVYSSSFPAVDCIMSSWTAWSSCSVSCGLGSLFRQRDILREAVPGGFCGGAQFDSRACFPRACPGLFVNISKTSLLPLHSELSLIRKTFSCSWRSLVRVDGMVRVWHSLWRRSQAEEQNLFCSSPQKRWARMWGEDAADTKLQQRAMHQRYRYKHWWSYLLDTQIW